MPDQTKIANYCLECRHVATASCERLGHTVGTLQRTRDEEKSLSGSRAESPRPSKAKIETLAAALRKVLRTGLNGGDNIRLAYIAAGQKALTPELLAKAEASATSRELLTGTPGFSIHQLVEIRSAILRVIDDGCNCDTGEKHPWEFYEDGTEGGNVGAYTEDMANANRLRFVDAIQSILTARLKDND